MTLQELYTKIDGDYEQVCRVLRLDKLIDKHIRKFAHNELVDQLNNAKADLNPTDIFEITHALKGVSANLGLSGINRLSSEITEDFRPGNQRKLSDEEVRNKIDEINSEFLKIVDVVKEYEGSNQ